MDPYLRSARLRKRLLETTSNLLDYAENQNTKSYHRNEKAIPKNLDRIGGIG